MMPGSTAWCDSVQRSHEAYSDTRLQGSHMLQQMRTAQNCSDSLFDFELGFGCQTVRKLWLVSNISWLLHYVKPCVVKAQSFKKLGTRESCQCLVRSVGLYTEHRRTRFRFHWSAPWTTPLSQHSSSLDRKPTQLACRTWRCECILVGWPLETRFSYSHL